MTTYGAPIYPVAVETVSQTWVQPGPWVANPTTAPGSGYVDRFGHAVDQSSGVVTLADTTNSTWTAHAQIWGNGTDQSNASTVAQFPVRADAVNWDGIIVEVSHQGVPPLYQDIIGYGQWSLRNTRPGLIPPFTYPTYPNQWLVPASSGWATYQTYEVSDRNVATWFAAGDFALVFTQSLAFSDSTGPHYPYQYAWARIIPVLSVIPPLRQRQRSDGLAASGAPRQHQRATLQTSIRQRAIR